MKFQIIRKRFQKFFWIFWIVFFFLLFVPVSFFGLSFPDSPFFSYHPGYGFRLVSNLSNTVEVKTSIKLSETFAKTGLFYYNWRILLNLDGMTLNYRIKFRVDSDGNLYAEEFGDGLFVQTDFPDVPVVPARIDFKGAFKVSDSISFRMIRYIPSVKINDQVYHKVVEASLSFGTEKVQLYFVKDLGLIGIKTPREIFKIVSET